MIIIKCIFKRLKQKPPGALQTIIENQQEKYKYMQYDYNRLGQNAQKLKRYTTKLYT